MKNKIVEHIAGFWFIYLIVTVLLYVPYYNFSHGETSLFSLECKINEFNDHEYDEGQKYYYSIRKKRNEEVPAGLFTPIFMKDFITFETKSGQVGEYYRYVNQIDEYYFFEYDDDDNDYMFNNKTLELSVVEYVNSNYVIKFNCIELPEDKFTDISRNMLFELLES